MRFAISAVHNDVQLLERLLADRPKARIIRLISHEQRMGFHLVVNEDDSQYLDDFGLEIYQAQEVDWQGEMADIDERFEEGLPF